MPRGIKGSGKAKQMVQVSEPLSEPTFVVPKARRRPVNLTANDQELVVLCDDGSVWVFKPGSLSRGINGTWERLPDVPA